MTNFNPMDAYAGLVGQPRPEFVTQAPKMALLSALGAVFDLLSVIAAAQQDVDKQSGQDRAEAEQALDRTIDKDKRQCPAH